MKDYEEQLDYSQITPTIYVGNNSCCVDYLEEELGKNGITAVISMEEGRDENPFGVKYYLWLPTTDKTAPSMEQLELGVQTLTYFVENSIKTYVHCRLGHGRAPTLVMAYLISTGMSFKEAYNLHKEKRPEIHLDGNQEETLREYERSLNG